EPPSNKVEKPAEDKAEKTGASKPRKIRFADEGPDRPPGVDDDADVTEFLKEDRSKSKIKPSPEGSPLREDAKTSVNKSRTRDAKKTNEDDVWGALQRAQDEPAAWSLKELRERLTVPWVLKHQGHLKQALEEALRRPRLAHDARHELTACLSAFGTFLGDRAREFVEWTLDVYDLSIPDESRILLLKALLEASCLTIMGVFTQFVLENCCLYGGVFILTGSMIMRHHYILISLAITWHCDAESCDVVQTRSTCPAHSTCSVHLRARTSGVSNHNKESAKPSADFFYSQTVMARAQTMLEGTDDCELLLAAAALSLWAAEQDPDAFAASHFHDTVDILVGWHIDASSPALARRTGKTLEALAPFWVADPAFCATLLGQFVEDLEAYADDLSQEDPCECLDKMASLLRVYGTVVQALGSHAVQAVTWELLSDNLHGMLNCVLHATEYAPRNALLVSANQTLGLLTDLTGECPSALVDLLELQCGLSPLSEEHALSVLHLLSVLVARLGPQLPLPLVAVAFGRRWSRSPRARIQGALLAVQRAILRLKSVALVEEAYRCVVAALSNDAEPGPRALAAATSLGPLCALSEVANARHSIIGVKSRSSLFLHLLASTVALRLHPGTLFPPVTVVLRHGQFVSSSVLVTGGDVLGVPSSGHLSRILTLLARVLASDEIADDARLLGLHWTVELMHAVQMHMGRVVDSPEFLGLVDAVIQSGHRCDVDMASKSCDILRAVVDTVGTCLPRSMLQRCYDLSVMKAGSVCQAERSKFIALMALLPIDLIVSNLAVANLPDQASQRSAVLSAPATSLTAQGFRSVMSALLLPTHPDSAAVHPRLERLAPARLAASGRHAGLLWFWALWEAAQTCVALKLRTPLGKPQETFTSVEAALKGLLGDPLEDAASLKRAQLLIDFLEHLDKAMYNAYEGTAATLSPPPKAVRTFFRTNRATCLEWLTRVRPKAVKVALRAGRFAEALRHAWALGTPTSAWSPASAAVGFESVLLDVAKCLVALRCPEALTGLYAYSKSALGQRIPWLKAAAAHAGGRLESAAEEYAELVFEDDVTTIKTPKDLKYFVFNQLLDCHARLSDWSGALNWMEDVVPMNGCGPIGTRALDAARHIRFLLSAARLARKQHNLRLAEHWLLLEAGCGDTVSLATLGEEGAPSPVLREGAKLLHTSGRVAEAARALVRVAQTEANNPAEEELVARSLLTLAKWLQADASVVEPHLGGTLSQCRNGALVDGWQRVGPPVQPLDGLLSAPEAAVGALLQRSLLLCPSLPKAWATYAAWCYRWGRKVVDAPRRAPVATSSRNSGLRSGLQGHAERNDGKLPLSAKDASDLSYILPETLTEEETNAIKHILTRVQASQACPEGGDWALGAEPGPEGAWPGLQQELEEACPQLEPRVIESLLEARSRLVGQTYQYYRASASAYIKYLQLNYQASFLSTVCFFLSSTLAQVRSLVQELRRITLLWDELWLSALNVHSAEAHRRIRTLEEEVGRVRNNPSLSPTQRESLIRDKHAVFLCPTLRVLEQLQSLVSREAETPHELWFKDTLGPLIEETLSALREPADPSRPQASWAALRRLHLRLQRRPHDEGPQLLMERVSPALAQLRDSRVPMPGCSGDVRIAAVQSSIAVLPTKTKPKKLGFQ
ncbi:unnamed protein product, partial [Ixodes pacificus]